jgi:phosphoribosylanthranilate isomerase
MFLKVCGITRAEDAAHAVAHGATALGFIFWTKSPRYIAPERAAGIIAAVPPEVLTVGVFVDEAEDVVHEVAERTGIAAVQLHGHETPSFVVPGGRRVFRSMTLESSAATCEAWPADTTLLLDAADPVRRGGTGTAVDWDAAAAVARRRPIVLAGGLTPGNVGGAIAVVRPFGVDVSSGVEAAPGVKDRAKVTEFLTNARAAFERL